MNKAFGTAIVFLATFIMFHALFEIAIGFSLAAFYALMKAQLFWVVIMLPSIGMAAFISYDYWNKT